MATKKKTRKKTAKKKAAVKKALKKPAKKSVKKTSGKKPLKKAAMKKPALAAKVTGKPTSGGRAAAAPKRRLRGKSETVDAVVFEPAGLGGLSSGQSGDLQGLSNRARASSESVDELLEEGNAFEAEVVKGVEDVEDEQEVRTHEVPEDDVPGEYLDKD